MVCRPCTLSSKGKSVLKENEVLSVLEEIEEPAQLSCGSYANESFLLFEDGEMCCSECGTYVSVVHTLH